MRVRTKIVIKISEIKRRKKAQGLNVNVENKLTARIKADRLTLEKKQKESEKMQSERMQTERKSEIDKSEKTRPNREKHDRKGTSQETEKSMPETSSKPPLTKNNDTKQHSNEKNQLEVGMQAPPAAKSHASIPQTKQQRKSTTKPK